MSSDRNEQLNEAESYASPGECRRNRKCTLTQSFRIVGREYPAQRYALPRAIASRTTWKGTCEALFVERWSCA
jgi:hypothetical protein